MSNKKLFTLNRQLFDRHTGARIGNIQSYCPTFDIEEVQEKIREIQYNISRGIRVRNSYSEITSRGDHSWSKDYIYSFTVYTDNTQADYWIECHDLTVSNSVMFDRDLM